MTAKKRSGDMTWEEFWAWEDAEHIRKVRKEKLLHEDAMRWRFFRDQIVGSKKFDKMIDKLRNSPK